MGLHSIKRIGQTSAYGIWSVPDSSGGKSAGNFQQNFARQLKEHYKGRIISLFDEIDREAASSFQNIDLANFEKYRNLISELISEVVNNAFTINKECILDRSGKQRIYATISIIDKKLDNLASDILTRNIERINFISRIDEIRGLVDRKSVV